MREPILLLTNIFAMILITLVMIFFQGTLWYHLFGWAPAPMFWLLPAVYLTLYRSANEGLFMVYAVALITSTFTSKPLTLLAVYSLILFFLVITFKSRIYWEGFRYYAMVTTVTALIYQILDITLSFILVGYVFSQFHLIERLLAVCLTGLFSFPIYRLLLFTDRVTEKDRFSVPGSHAI